MQPTASKKNTMVNTVRDFMLIGITIALIYWLLAPEEDQSFYPVTLANLKGVWTTTHPQYQNRFLQFSDDTVTFGWGQEGVGSYSIQDFDTEPIENSTLVHINYTDTALTDYQLRFHYVVQNGGIIWMKNQKQVTWRRTSTEPVNEREFR